MMWLFMAVMPVAMLTSRGRAALRRQDEQQEALNEQRRQAKIAQRPVAARLAADKQQHQAKLQETEAEIASVQAAYDETMPALVMRRAEASAAVNESEN